MEDNGLFLRGPTSHDAPKYFISAIGSGGPHIFDGALSRFFGPSFVNGHVLAT